MRLLVENECFNHCDLTAVLLRVACADKIKFGATESVGGMAGDRGATAGGKLMRAA
jgi:hypothetical protein